MSDLSRRDFSATLAASLLGAAMPPLAAADERHAPGPRPAAAGRAAPQPITAEERAQRVEKARRLMRENGLGAILLEPGTSMSYFAGVRWGLSERPFLLVLPARGEPAWVCPAFEEARARELTGEQADVRVWQEDESPYRQVARILADRGMKTGKLGVEERVRFFIADGVRLAAPGVQVVSADAVTAGCRMFKSPAELALLQAANDVTVGAFREVLPKLKEGMAPEEVSGLFGAAHRKLGGSNPWALVLFGEASAFPHGTTKPRLLREGDTVLMDIGCSVEGYQSDVTRTVVFGAPTARQREIWALEQRAQNAAAAAVRVGNTCDAVDRAARGVIEAAGFGPGYKLPGLPHRTGHGIGMDGHEWTNFVKGNMTRLQPGMCFSDEPTIAIYGEFGVRFEDCLVVTENGPRFFTDLSVGIQEPFPGMKVG
ncbi:MAG: Xaa-Pro peptidase family protein [Gemmatimonadales bacterium]|nr:Xaa-Pro peptidase family protein [Gemmatimonadales bacterium]